MKIVYKINEYCSIDRGIVISETTNQYKVKSIYEKGTILANWTWRKSECFDSIEATQNKLTKMRENKVAAFETQLIEARKRLDEDLGWHKTESEIVARLQKMDIKL